MIFDAGMAHQLKLSSSIFLKWRNIGSCIPLPNTNTFLIFAYLNRYSSRTGAALIYTIMFKIFRLTLNVITCATPYEGSPKIINIQCSGDVFDEGYKNSYLREIGLDTEAIKKFVTTSQLVPTERYLNELRRIHNLDSKFIPMQEKIFSQKANPIKYFDDYKIILKDIFEIDDKSNAIENAISFQKSLLVDEKYNCLYDYEKAYFVIGKNKKTISSMDFSLKGTEEGKLKFYINKLNYTNNGDETVPYLSASMLSKLDPDSDNVEAFENTHLGLLQDKKVIEWIETILDGNPAPVKSSVSAPSPYAVIRVACPVDVEISDGNDILSSVEGAESFDASFGRLDLIGINNEIKMICMDEDTNLDINLTGTDTGTMDYTIRHYSADEELLDERTFENVPITDKTVIKTKADNTEVTVLSVDNDGDGVVDNTWTAKKNEIIKCSDSEKNETITSSPITVATTTTTTKTTTGTVTTIASTTTTAKPTATTSIASTTTTVQSTTVTTTTTSTTTTTVPATKKVLGDIDGNGILDAVDASKILGSYAKYSTGSKAPTEDDLAVKNTSRIYDFTVY